MTTNVVTRSFGNSRMGCFVDPSWTLTSEQVQKAGVRVLGQLKLDDPRGAEGQVLAVADLTMSDSKAHNVVFVCDMSNNVYAFDADSCALLWKQNVARPITITKQWDMWMINPFPKTHLWSKAPYWASSLRRRCCEHKPSLTFGQRFDGRTNGMPPVPIGDVACDWGYDGHTCRAFVVPTGSRAGTSRAFASSRHRGGRNGYRYPAACNSNNSE